MHQDSRPTTSARQPGNLRRLVASPGYPYLFLSSFLWHTTRWGELFVVTYLLTGLAGSAMTNQTAGALLFAPMLLGGFLMGAVSDRFERRTFLLGVQLLLVPVEFSMVLLVHSGTVQTWHTFPFMFAVGVGGVVNMTAQRPLICEIVGPSLAAPAMTVEATAQAGSAMFGALVGGVVIDRFGLASAFATMGLLLCGSAALLWLVPRPRWGVRPQDRPRSTVLEQLRTGGEMVRRSPRLVGTLAVTVVMNLCMFGYLPLVPLAAQRFTDSATLTGALASAPGLGQILGGAMLSVRVLPRHGLVFAAGSALALAGLFGFASAPTYGLAMGALLVSGLGQAAFASMQSLLAIEGAADHERGVALGVLSTAIGALPLGIMVVGLVAGPLGTQRALLACSMVGLAALGAVVLRFPVLLTRNPTFVPPP